MYKIFIKKWFLGILISSMLIIIFNVLVDPIGIFKHEFKFNSMQDGFNERLQKTAQLKYKYDVNNFDSVLFGSSRLTYYDQTKFENIKVFNYSFASAVPYQFNRYMNFIKEHKKTNFENIILGLDFYGTKFYDLNDSNDENTIADIKNNRVLLKFFSLDLAKYSLNNIYLSLSKTTGHGVYNRNNVINIDKIREEDVENISLARVKNYNNYENYKYSKEYKNDLQKLKVNNEESNFIVFTTPLGKPFLDRIFSDEVLTESYYQWIYDMIDVYGRVYFFTYHNYFSENYKSLSKDGDHYYPNVVENISKIVMKQLPLKDYGLLITKDNVDNIVAFLQSHNTGNNLAI